MIRHLVFGDYLNTFKEKAKEYESLKIKLTKLYPYDIEKYCDGKDELVKRLESEVLIWHKKALSGFWVRVLTRSV
ncbi:GrpB family protein [Campylobacter sp. US33a]|uniref:GrpB family protein n=1 Tax=Campylobacter sp. US33a TaxID=2498120 RepID=UPI001ABAEDD0